MATIRPSKEIVEQIKKFEKFEPKKYPDLKTGKMAIGFGDTEGDTSKEITIEEATTRLHNRLARAGDSIGKRLNREIHQDHQDVLLDMEYNGGGGMLDETIDRINSGVSDEEIAQKLTLYNKSTDVETKKKFYVQNLQDRANHRSQVWLRSKGIAAPENVDQPEDDMLDGFEPQEEMQAAMSPNGSPLEEDMLDGFEPQTPSLSVSQKSRLDFAADSIVPESAEDQMRVKEAKRLSAKLNRPYADVLEELYITPANEIMARNAHALTASHFPAVTTWAQKEDANYVLMRDTEDYTQKIEARTKLINKDSNFEKAAKSNITLTKSAMVYMGMFSGKFSHNEAKQYLRDIEAEKKSQAMTGDVARTQQMAAAESSKMGKGFKKILDGAFPDKGDELSTALPRLKEVYDGSIEAADGFFGMMGEYLSNPEAFGLMLTQSAGSSIAPAALALGGAATLNPVGAAAGIGSSFALGAAFGFAGRMDENLEEFRNPNTGDIDFDRAFSDPKQVAVWEREAATYGVTLGAADTLFTLVGGRFFSMAEKSAAKSAGSVAGKVGGAVASGGAKGAEEAGSEFIGTIAADVVGGKFSKDSIAKAGEKSVMEGIAGSFMGPIIGYAASRVDGYIETKKQAVGKLVKTVEKSSEANKNTVKLAEIRATVSSNEVGVQNIDQVKDLIDESLKGDDLPPPFHPEDDLDVEPFIESEMADFNRRKSGLVEISPREWDEHFESLGLDPLVEIGKLGPEARMAYQAGKGTDTSFTLPASEWTTYTPEQLDPSADAIARLNGTDYNSVEANENLKEIMKDPFVSLDQFFESEEPPSIPGQEDPASDVGGSEEGIQIIEPTEADGNIVSRPINLIQKGRTEAGQKVFLDITRSMKAATDGSPDVDPETIDVLAEIYMTRLNHRSELLGVPVEELASKLKFGVVAKKAQESTRGSYFPKRTMEGIAKMVFGRHADAPTLVHEFGHAFLQEMAEDFETMASIPEESMTVAQREYKRSMDTAAKHLKLSDMGELLTLDLGKFRRAHEIFAQTTESYFFEGKFENSGIRFLMDMFRKWMLPYAKTIAQTYLKYPALKITPEIERMFEAIIGGSNKAEEVVVPMFQPSMFGDQILEGKEGAKYQAILDEVRSQAIGGTYTELFNRGIKEREKLIYKHSVEYTKRATENVDQTPPMQMLKYFQDIHAEHKAGEIPESRISIESVAEYLFADDIDAAQDFKKSLPSVVISGLKKGGIDVRQFMAMNDINSKEQMIQLLEGTAKRDEWIDAEFDQIVREELPIYKTDDEIHAIAVEKMNMDGKEKLLAEEMRILATKYLPTLKGVTSKLINPATFISKDAKPVLVERAVNQIAQTRMSQYDRSKFLRDSERQGRESSKQFKKDDFQKAFDAKYLQSQNFYAYQAGRDVDKYIAHTNLIVKKVKNFKANKQNAMKYDIEIVNYGKKVIFAIENGMQIPAFTDKDFSDFSPVSETQVASINQIAQTFAAEIGTQTKDLTVSDHIAMGRLINAIVKVAKAVRHLELDGKALNVIEIGNEIAAGLNVGKNVVNYQTDKKGSIASWSRVLKMNTTSLLKGMYESDEAYIKSPLAVIERNIREAEAQVNLSLAGSEKRISESLKKTFRKEDKYLKAIFEPVTGRAYRLVGKSTDKPIAAGKLNYTFNSKSDLNAAMLMALGSQSGMNKFMQGNLKAETDLDGNVNPAPMWAQVQEFINDGTLNKADFEFYQVVWNEFAPVHPLVDKAMRIVDGREIGEVEAKPFSVTVEGETIKLSGGYFPASRDRDSMSTTQKVAHLETNNIDAHDMYASRQIGLTKTRTDQAYPVNLDLRNVTRYLSTALNIAHLRVPMDAFNKIIHSPAVAEVIERRRPGAIENVIIPSFERTKNQVYTEFSRDGKDNMARYLRNNVNQVLYLANVKSALKQFLGLGQAATYLGGYRLAKTSMFIAANPKASRRVISDASIVMRERYNNSVAAFARTITDLDTNNFDWISWTDEKTQQATFLLSQTTQNIVDTIVWQTGYNKARDEMGMEPNMAIAYADDAVITSQSSAAVSSLTNLQSGRDSAKLFTQVLSVPIAISNNASVEMQRDQKKRNKAIFMAKLGLYSIMVPIALELKFTPETDEEEEKNKRKSADEQMDDKIFMLNSRAATSGLELVMPMLTRPISGNLGPVFGVMGDGSRALNAVGNKIGGVDMSDRDLQVLLDQAALYGGKGVFALASQGLTYYDSLVKSKNEKRHEKLVRRHQLLRKKYADRR